MSNCLLLSSPRLDGLFLNSVPYSQQANHNRSPVIHPVFLAAILSKKAFFQKPNKLKDTNTLFGLWSTVPYERRDCAEAQATFYKLIRNHCPEIPNLLSVQDKEIVALPNAISGLAMSASCNKQGFVVANSC